MREEKRPETSFYPDSSFKTKMAKGFPQGSPVGFIFTPSALQENQGQDSLSRVVSGCSREAQVELCRRKRVGKVRKWRFHRRVSSTIPLAGILA